MNPALSIPEVIRLVCNELDVKSSRATALTCRALLEPSLDRLWHTIETFEPFISCLPPIAFNVVREEVPDKFTYLVSAKSSGYFPDLAAQDSTWFLLDSLKKLYPRSSSAIPDILRSPHSILHRAVHLVTNALQRIPLDAAAHDRQRARRTCTSRAEGSLAFPYFDG
jgi:hypothetical protein